MPWYTIIASSDAYPHYARRRYLQHGSGKEDAARALREVLRQQKDPHAGRRMHAREISKDEIMRGNYANI